MSVDTKTVAKIANLARIKIEDNKLTPMADELNKILSWVEQLDEVDTKNTEPMTSVVESKLPWRKDEVNDGENPEAVLKNAPASEYGHFAVPKVIE